MSPQSPRASDASRVSPRRTDGARGRRGRWIGPIQITPIRVVLVVGLVGSLAYIALAILTVKDSAQIPMVTTGIGVLGVIFAALSVGGAIRMWGAWRDGLQGQTVLFAVVGGIAGMLALGCLAGTLILALVWGS
jgi:hypothetical protein